MAVVELFRVVSVFQHLRIQSSSLIIAILKFILNLKVLSRDIYLLFQSQIHWLQLRFIVAVTVKRRRSVHQLVL